MVVYDELTEVEVTVWKGKILGQTIDTDQSVYLLPQVHVPSKQGGVSRSLRATRTELVQCSEI